MSPVPLIPNVDESHRYAQLRSNEIGDIEPTSTPTRRNSILPPLELLGSKSVQHPHSGITDRAQLIQKIKAGQAPNWSPSRNDLRIHFFADRPFQEDIDRPKSALHSGVFTDDSGGKGLNHPPTPISSNFEISFQNAFHPANQTFSNHPLFGHGSQPGYGNNFDVSPSHGPLRLRTGSISSLSNFVFKVPTSPLVYSSNTEHMDTESTSPRSSAQAWTDNIVETPTSPSLSSMQFSPSSQHTSHPRHYSLSYKRRSVAESYSDGSINKPPRRLSSGLGLSELPVGSFVGSYEESILNGRMSTTPSKPLTFVAKIGVLGVGKCKPALRCPTHVTIPFPAYFYSVGDYDSPSPYVGQIDLDALAETSNKKFPYGGYRIPQQGQLQIVIKNPNKTAVKLFLVPYDLRDMEVGTKTFVRQKSFATGNALLEELLPVQEQRKVRNRERESLRYLIHLHICCPSRGRYYLYRNIRVVFANRVPDGKEKLRNEILLPNPRYSVWKPGKESISACSSISSVGRKRSQSLHGTMGADHCGKPHSRGCHGEDHKEKAPPIPTLPAQYLNWNSSGTITLPKLDIPGPTTPLEIPKREVGRYDKIPASMYSSSLKSEGHGLLARKLKGLDVEEQD